MKNKRQSMNPTEKRGWRAERPGGLPTCALLSIVAVAALTPGSSFSGSAATTVAQAVPGRPLLWSAECYRVLDDPSAVNRYVFRSFQQYRVFCIEGRRSGTPWNRKLLAGNGRAGLQGYNRADPV